ncbi:MAG: TPM domain-containing protein [Spirochaetaceae bacterium]|nr:MAG: TPM domain-containing protein [Spirochaetaceae bacterium]
MLRNAKASLWAAAAFMAAILLVAVAPTVTAQQLPRPTGYVNDFVGLISAEDRSRIEAVIEAVRAATGAEIAVVTVPSYGPYGSIEQFGVALAESWGVGSSADDSGAILILAMQERQVRIEVGYGLEGILPDGRVGAILDELVLPRFREENWGAGMLGGVQGLAGYIAEEYEVDLAAYGARTPQGGTASSAATPLDSLGELLWVLMVISVVGGRFLWPLLFIGAGRRGYYGGGFGAATRGRSSTGFGGGSSGGSFGGFSGGGFGGGGASRGF